MAHIASLQRIVRDREEQVRQLQERNFSLRLRRAVLAVMMRNLEEVAAHKRAYGVSDTEELRQLEALLQEAGDGTPDGADATAPFHIFVEHLRPGRSLLQLESMAPQEVQEIRQMDYASAKAKLHSMITEGQQLMQEIDRMALGDFQSGPAQQDANQAGGPAAVVEVAKKWRLRAIGRWILHISCLLMTWNCDLFMSLSARHHGSGADCVGTTDAPTQVWDQALKGANLCREQVMMFMDSSKLMYDRLRKLRVQRGALSEQLQRLSAAGASAALNLSAKTVSGLAGSSRGRGGASAAAGSGGTSSGGSGGSEVGDLAEEANVYDDFTPEEVVDCLAVNMACERFVVVTHSLVNQVIMDDEQRARLFCLAYPYPINNKACVEAIHHLLLIDGDQAFPWRGRPWGT